MDAYNVQSVAQKLAWQLFPDIADAERGEPWKCPKPGQWLEVCRIDRLVEEYFKKGDLLYFRRLSPLGLFECYAPTLNGLFWIGPEDVRSCDIAKDESPSVPY